MTKVLIALIVAVLLVACVTHVKGKGGHHFAQANTDEFERLLAQDSVQLLDVRTQEEFDQGHLAGAILIDVKQDNFEQRALQQLDRSRPVAVYCRSGRRSSHAAGILAVNGYTVTNLEGGILAWQAASKPVVKP